ncbi:MAG TPA: RIP metalloprotease RseP [Acidobacteriota bacterium]|nr:RIP metalloprotease RseP [Acidobacteriota bacterium]
MLITILAFIVVLGITITVHEFGHFAMAKLLKIRVLVFSFGFGPRLVGFTRGGTEYRVSPFLLGGYVKMAGETFEEERQGAPDEFLSHPKWHRLLVYLAGPFMNVALAVAILSFSYLEGIYVPRYHKQAPVVGPVTANSLAQRAGLETGDRILSVRGNSVRTWEEMEIALATAPRDALDLVVERGNGRLRLHLDPPNSEQVDPNSLGFKFSIPRTIVAAVDPKSPAQAAGLKDGDEILSVEGNGRVGKDYDEILNIISASKGIPLHFEIRRPGEIRHTGSIGQNAIPELPETGKILRFTITPQEKEGRVVIGFVPEIPADLEKYGLGGAIVQSVRRNYEMSALTFRIIGRIFRGSASVKTISGPLGIAQIAGSAARTGSARVFFGFLGLVSLQLGVFNLLPIPILDGGGIALLLVEGIIGRDLSFGIKEKIIQVGFVFLILLMGFVVFNDLSKIVDFDKLRLFR